MYGTLLHIRRSLILLQSTISLVLGLFECQAESTRSGVTVTAYCNCRICCGENYSAKYPRTASGTVPEPSRTVACNWLPFGTVIELGGRRYIVEDRMAKRYSDRVDIFVSSHELARQFGKRKYTVRIIKKPTTKKI